MRSKSLPITTCFNWIETSPIHLQDKNPRVKCGHGRQRRSNTVIDMFKIYMRQSIGCTGTLLPLLWHQAGINKDRQKRSPGIRTHLGSS